MYSTPNALWWHNVACGLEEWNAIRLAASLGLKQQQIDPPSNNIQPSNSLRHQMLQPVMTRSPFLLTRGHQECDSQLTQSLVSIHAAFRGPCAAVAAARYINVSLSGPQSHPAMQVRTWSLLYTQAPRCKLAALVMLHHNVRVARTPLSSRRADPPSPHAPHTHAAATRPPK